MNTTTKREIVATLVQAGRRDLAEFVVTAAGWAGSYEAHAWWDKFRAFVGEANGMFGPRHTYKGFDFWFNYPRKRYATGGSDTDKKMMAVLKGIGSDRSRGGPVNVGFLVHVDDEAYAEKVYAVLPRLIKIAKAIRAKPLKPGWRQERDDD